MPPQQRRTTITRDSVDETRKRAWNRKRIWVTVISTLLVVVVLIAGAFIGARTFLNASKSSTTVELDTRVNDEFVQDSSNQKQTTGPSDGAVDYLLVGADSRVDMQGNPLTEEQQRILRSGDVDTTNTDVIMVVRVSGDGKKAVVTSIPRDTYVTDREYGNTKINAVYGMHQGSYLETTSGSGPETQRAAADEGRKALAETVNTLTGVTIDHYVEVGLFGFSTFTDAVGGVDVCLVQATNDPMTGASFPAGKQTLNGPDALAFVRQRYGLTNGDLDRVKRQQAYLSSMLNKLLSAGTLTNPSKLKALLDATEQTVAIDQNLSLMDAAQSVANIDPNNITFGTIPVVTINGTGDHGESVVEVNKEEVRRYFEGQVSVSSSPVQPQSPAPHGETVMETPDDLPEDIAAVTSVTSARVFSVNGKIEPARDAAKKLADDGVVVTDIALSPTQWSQSGSQVLVNSPSPAADRIASLLDVPVVMQQTLPPGTIVVLVGAPASSQPAPVSINPSPTAPVASVEGETSVSDGVVCVN